MAADIQQHRGSLLDAPSGILLHGCNAQGVMGAGVARAIRAAFPEAFAAYRRTYLSPRGLQVGSIISCEVRAPAGAPRRVVINAITQAHYGRGLQLSYEALGRCLKATAEYAVRERLRDIHFPLIGCGLAGGDWRRVEPLILDSLGAFNLHLWQI